MASTSSPTYEGYSAQEISVMKSLLMLGITNKYIKPKYINLDVLNQDTAIILRRGGLLEDKSLDLIEIWYPGLVVIPTVTQCDPEIEYHIDLKIRDNLRDAGFCDAEDEDDVIHSTTPQ